MMTTTYHVKAERTERIDYIIDIFNGCFGTEEFSYTIETDRGQCKMVLTSKGIIYLQSIKTKKVITMYIATMAQAIFVYRHSHLSRSDKMPNKLYHQVRNNARYLTAEYFMLT